MSKITDRYASAIRSSKLVSQPDTTMSDTDVLGAFGLAGKAVRSVTGKDGKVTQQPGRPIAVALQRHFLGDDRGGMELVRLLAPMLWSRAREAGLKPKMRLVESEDITRQVLRWFRNPRCRHCFGHGFGIVAGTMGTGRAVVGNVACPHCKLGKRPFETEFPATRRDLVLWLHDLIEREQAAAGAAAMQALAPRLDFLQPR